MAGVRAASDDQRDVAAEGLVNAVVKEVEPLLASTEGKGPFFGGSEKLTFAEVSVLALTSVFLVFYQLVGTTMEYY